MGDRSRDGALALPVALFIRLLFPGKPYLGKDPNRETASVNKLDAATFIGEIFMQHAKSLNLFPVK